ncbi:MAG: aminomethyl-transferring glycine dehydrogenase subunit GcvPA [Actinobacteria bacterium]|nr:aminomethyl-transferring glycine dehydrogenase subunit GcvPA [Actinomycetota bacterium]MBU1493915.1 aminomethyl-transferring glycine dehydrogenase subunit GcvPA [Actinomycetota bacterium]
MDFTPHTDADVERMLATLGVADPAGLFGHLPAEVLLDHPLDLPQPMAELEVMRYLDGLAGLNRSGLVCFAGGGVYDHFLPPVVRALTLRPEFVTSYTPYQAEVAQGVLQALFEYQSMIAAITGLPVANASLYDGATAGLEAVNLAVAATGRRVVWVSRALHPHTREVIATLAHTRDLAVVEHPVVGGRTAWAPDAEGPPALVVLGQPNYLGVIEDYGAAATVARSTGALLAASVDPMLLGVLRSPGEAGCDIAFGEGQPLGNPMSFGGPVLGVFATTEALLRRMPGRLVGRTTDEAGRAAFTLTLRTREQDIRRERASSNICTNQTLNAIGAAVHLAWLGPGGLAEAGRQSIQKAHYLAGRLARVKGVRAANPAPFAREFAILTPVEPAEVVSAMGERGYLAGIPLSGDYPELPGGLLVAVTEQRTRDELDGYTAALEEVIADA